MPQKRLYILLIIYHELYFLRVCRDFCAYRIFYFECQLNFLSHVHEAFALEIVHLRLLLKVIQKMSFYILVDVARKDRSFTIFLFLTKNDHSMNTKSPFENDRHMTKRKKESGKKSMGIRK